MKIRILRRGIRLVPEGDLEFAYIEEVLGLRNAGDIIELERVHLATGDIVVLEAGFKSQTVPAG